jgi:Holliday junction resolvasome RuvABC DNA-binding subunit
VPFEPARIDVARQVFAALIRLGFKSSEARARIDAIQRRGTPAAVREFLLAALHVG